MERARQEVRAQSVALFPGIVPHSLNVFTDPQNHPLKEVLIGRSPYRTRRQAIRGPLLKATQLMWSPSSNPHMQAVLPRVLGS